MMTNIPQITQNQTYIQTSARWESLLKNNLLREAIQDLQIFIDTHPYDFDEIYGLGNEEDLKIACISENQIDWYYQTKATNKALDNPYDLLSLLYINHNDKANTIQWYQEMLSKYKECYKLTFGLANAYYNNCSNVKSQRTYHRVIELNPEFDKAYLELAWLFSIRYCSFQKSVMFAQKALTLNNNNFCAKLIIAGFDPQFERSIKLIAKLKLQQPNNIYVYCAQAFRKVNNTGFTQQVEQILTTAMKINPKCQQPYIYLGKFLYNVPQRAIQYHLKALELNPKNGLAYNELGFAYYYNDQYQKALQCYKKVFEINPNESFALHMCGVIHTNQLDIKKAKECYKKCIRNNPYYYKAILKLGDLSSQQEQYIQLIDIYLIHLDVCEQSYIQRRIYGFIQEMLLKMVEMGTLLICVKQIQILIFKKVRRQDIAIKFAEILLEQNHYDQGQIFVNLCLKMNAKNISAIFFQAQILTYHGKIPETLITYSSVLKMVYQDQQQLDKGLSNTIISLLDNLTARQSIQWLQKNSQFIEKNVHFLVSLGKRYMLQGQYELALKNFHKAQMLASNQNFYDNQIQQLFGKEFCWRERRIKGQLPVYEYLELKRLEQIFHLSFYKLFVK